LNLPSLLLRRDAEPRFDMVVASTGGCFYEEMRATMPAEMPADLEPARPCPRTWSLRDHARGPGARATMPADLEPIRQRIQET
jgi:hypothetical protein